jgi:hypothetical protein
MATFMIISRFLSPERRFDAIIFNSPDLFEEGL